MIWRLKLRSLDSLDTCYIKSQLNFLLNFLFSLGLFKNFSFSTLCLNHKTKSASFRKIKLKIYNLNIQQKNYFRFSGSPPFRRKKVGCFFPGIFFRERRSTSIVEKKAAWNEAIYLSLDPHWPQLLQCSQIENFKILFYFLYIYIFSFPFFLKKIYMIWYMN